jgi:hypothetical protein
MPGVRDPDRDESGNQDMIRALSTIAIGLSLLLGAATAILWALSCWRVDSFGSTLRTVRTYTRRFQKLISTSRVRVTHPASRVKES